jgi:hypothetical protein
MANDDEQRAALYSMKYEADASYWSQGIVGLLFIGFIVLILCWWLLGTTLGTIVGFAVGAAVWTLIIVGHRRGKRARGPRPATTTASATTSQASNGIAQALRQVDDLRAQGSITGEEYAAKRAEILSRI